MKNYHLIMGVLVGVCLLVVSVIFFFDQNLSLTAFYILSVLLMISWIIHLMVCKKEINALEKRVDEKIDNLDKKFDERIKPMEKTYGYLHFLDEANLNIYRELQKAINKYTNLLKKRPPKTKETSPTE